MLGSIIGDIVGSRFEFHNIKTKDFSLFDESCCFTDDTILTCAVADHLISKRPIEETLRKWALKYQNRSYENGKIAAFGKGFLHWVNTGISINSSSNGCVMRISPIFNVKQDQQSLLKKADKITKITHNHPESLNAVHAYLETGFMIQNLIPIQQIKETISNKYQYNLHQSLDEIRPVYNRFYVQCKNSVPQAIICALDACSYEDALRNAVSLGGDSDTLACMAGGLAELRFKIPIDIIENAKKYMDKNIIRQIEMFYNSREKSC